MKINLAKFSLRTLFTIPALITAFFLISIVAISCTNYTQFTFPKSDSFLIVFGNLAIAIYIATIINKKNKNEELKIDSCFKEIDQLLKLIKLLRRSVNKDYQISDDSSFRLMSLISLQIDLIKNYNFINNDHLDKLDQYYRELDQNITGSDIVSEVYLQTLLQIEKRLLVIKSDIL